MKIVHVVYSMELGGAEMLVAQLGRTQRAAGHDVTVCAYSRLGPLGEVLQAEGLPVHVLGEAPVPVTMLRFLRLFLRMEPDVVHCHNPAPTLQAAAAGWLCGARVISTRHSLVSPPYDRAEELKFSLMAWAFVHRVAGICEITCQNLRGAPLACSDRIVRVYNGTAPLEDGPAPLGNGTTPLEDVGNGTAPLDGFGRVDSAAVRTEPGTFTLLFVGRVAEIKDLPTLLRAFARALREEPRLRLWIVGDGPARAGLQALADELGVTGQVRFWGQRLDTAAFFRAADLFTMSSVSEGLPMSLLQAMSIALPAVVTDVGGMREVVELSGGGLRVPVGDEAAMAEAVLRMASDDALRQRCAERARSSYERHFTLDVMDAAYRRLYTAEL